MYTQLKELTAEYLPEVSIVDASRKTFYKSSDHASYWEKGIKGLFFAEELDRYSADFNTNWHTDNDILGTSCNSRELMEVISRSAVLMTATAAGLVKKEAISKKKTSVSSSLLSVISIQQQGLQLNSTQSGTLAYEVLGLNGRVHLANMIIS